MIGLHADVEALLLGGFWHSALVFLRVSALVSLLPAFGSQTVPMRVRLVIAMAFTAIAAPAVPVFSGPPEFADMIRFTLTEVTIGLALGMGIRLFVLALQTAGSIAGQATSLSQIFGAAGMDPIPAMGQVLVFAGLALAVMAGLHVRAIEFVILSYDMLPAGQFPDGAALSDWGSTRVARAFALAFILAAPFVMTAVVYNLALGAINRAMPQLMVAFVGAPVITFAGLFILFAASPLLLSIWTDALNAFLSDPLEVR